MKKVLISLLIGVSMVTMVGCGSNSNEVVETKVEENVQEDKEEKETKVVNDINMKFAEVNSKRNSQQNNSETFTVCYIKKGTIHIYNFINYLGQNENEEVFSSVVVYFDKQLLDIMLETGYSVLNTVETQFELNGLDIDDYEVRYHDCIGHPEDTTFYELLVMDGDGDMIELFGEKVD